VAGEGRDPQLEAEARRLALAWLEDRKAIDPELAASVLMVAARHGDQALFQRFHEAAKKAVSSRDRERIFAALGSFQEQVPDAVSLFLSDEFDPLEARRILMASTSATTLAPFWDAFKTHYEPIVAKLPHEAGGNIPYFWRGFCDVGHRRDVEAFFKDRVDALPGAPRTLAQTLEAIDLCTAARTAQEAGLRQFLQAY
jgi:alanyl aminopeptidase